MDTATNKTLAVNRHAESSASKMDFFQKIETYVKNGEKIVNAEMLRFFRNVDAFLRKEIIQAITAEQPAYKIPTKIEKKIEK